MGDKLEIVSVAARGMRRGQPSDFSAVKIGLNLLLDHAESQWGCDIDRAAVCISSSLVSATVVTASIRLRGRAVTGDHLSRLRRAAEELDDSGATIAVGFIPQCFAVDQRIGLKNPVGMSGENLSGQFVRLSIDRHVANDFIKLFNDCGVQVVELIPNGLASAVSCQSAAEGNYALLDCGGGAGQGVVFVDGVLQGLISVPVGGTLITADIAAGLGVCRDDAERLKEVFGIARSEQSITCSGVDGNEKHVSGKDMMPFLAPRISDLNEYLQRELQRIGVTTIPVLILTGGTSQLKRLPQVLSYLSKAPVSTVFPSWNPPSDGSGEGPSGVQSIRHSPAHSGVIGALHVAAFGYPWAPTAPADSSVPSFLSRALPKWLRFSI